MSDCCMCRVVVEGGKPVEYCTGTDSQFCQKNERQNGIADFRNLGAVLRDAQKGFTIEFQSAVLAALMRIEARLSKS